jgi:hypothetical protein
VTPRRPPEEIAESLAFPEAVANAITLERTLRILLERLLARPERARRAPRQLAIRARLAGGGSWHRCVTLREASAELERLRVAIAPKLAELPGPVVELAVAFGLLADSPGRQEELVEPRGNRLRALLREGLRQVRAATGGDAVYTVVEVAPWSRIPEARAILVPRDD